MKLSEKVIETVTTPVRIVLERDAGMHMYTLYASTTLAGRWYQVHRDITDESLASASNPSMIMEAAEREVLRDLSYGAFQPLKGQL